METHVLHRCRKHSGCLHSLVLVPAICSSPFATPVLPGLSVSSTVLAVTYPHCSHFSVLPTLVPKPSFQHCYLPSCFFHYSFLSPSASHLGAACWGVFSVPGHTKGHFSVRLSAQLLLGLISSACVCMLAVCWRIEYSVKAAEEKSGAHWRSVYLPLKILPRRDVLSYWWEVMWMPSGQLKV